MKHFIPLLINFLLLSNCQHTATSKKIEGKWVNMSYSDVYDMVIVEFKDSYLNMYDKKDILYKLKWELDDGSLHISNRDNPIVFNRYKIIALEKDSLLLKGFYNDTLYFSSYEKYKSTFATKDIKGRDILTSGYWKNKTAEVDANMDSYYEFYPSGSGMNTFKERKAEDDEYVLPVAWEFIHVDIVNLIRIRSGFDQFFFVKRLDKERLTAKIIGSGYVPGILEMVNVEKGVPKNENTPKMLKGWWTNKTPKLSFYDDDKLISIDFGFNYFNNDYIIQFEKDNVSGEYYLSREGKFLMIQPQANKPELMLEILSISEDRLEMELLNSNKNKLIFQKLK